MNNILLEYKGSVDILLKISGKVINISSHNEGTPYLAKVFAKFISSQHDLLERVPQVDTPQFIDLQYRSYTVSGGSRVYDPWRSFLHDKISITSKTYDQVNNDWVAHLTGSLASGNMLSVVTQDEYGSTESGGYEFRLALQTGYDASYEDSYHDLAYLEVLVSSLEKIPSGTQATIVWNMKIINSLA